MCVCVCVCTRPGKAKSKIHLDVPARIAAVLEEQFHNAGGEFLVLELQDVVQGRATILVFGVHIRTNLEPPFDELGADRRYRTLLAMATQPDRWLREPFKEPSSCRESDCDGGRDKNSDHGR